MLGSLGISLITMETNWRELWHSLSLPWLDCHGAAYLACASMLQAEFRIVLLASTYSYGTVCPYGSTPIGDVLLSSNAQQVRHDGAGFSRVEKVALIGQWPEAMRNLHVCWEGSDGDLNCGVCEKCIRTILDFRVNGLPLPSAFASDVSDDLIASVPIRTDVQLNEFESILDRAIENGLAQESWVRTLEKRLQRAQWGPSPWAVARSRLQLRARVRRLRSLVWRQKER